MTTAELIEYYKNLLIIQYRTRSKALATVATYVGEIVADQIIDQVRSGFDLSTAIGAQLDILGTYKGVNRLIPGLNLNKQFFSMPSYNDPDVGVVKGFAVIADAPNINWYWLRYSDVVNPTYALSDDEMRRLIMFRAAVQSSHFGYGELDIILYQFFGTNVDLVDNLDMTITYNHQLSDPDTLFEIANATGSLPSPAGVAVIVNEV